MYPKLVHFIKDICHIVHRKIDTSKSIQKEVKLSFWTKKIFNAIKITLFKLIQFVFVIPHFVVIIF